MSPVRWKPGVEVPPLVAENVAAVAICQRILDGTIEEFPPICVSEAVAIQVYRMVFDTRVRAATSDTVAWADVYSILAAQVAACSSSALPYHTTFRPESSFRVTQATV